MVGMMDKMFYFKGWFRRVSDWILKMKQAVFVANTACFKCIYGLYQRRILAVSGADTTPIVFLR